MNTDLGLLAEKPYETRQQKWLARSCDRYTGLPDDIIHELAVFLSTPGFEHAYFAHVLKMHFSDYYKLRKKLPFLREEGLDNFASITLEDAIKLNKLRPHRQSGYPLCVQLHMLDLNKKGLGYVRIARVFGCGTYAVQRLLKQGYAHMRGPVPPEFAHICRQKCDHRKKWSK